jgi:aminopeptidase N
VLKIVNLLAAIGGRRFVLFSAHMKFRILLVIATGALLAASCGSLRKNQPSKGDGVVWEVLDAVEVTPEPTIRRQPKPKVNDLIHTRLDVRFDWNNRHLLGTATLTLKPWLYPSDRVQLDAQGMAIHSITLEGDTTRLTYDYNGKIIDIRLPKTYSRIEQYTLVIDYTARPDELEVEGGRAITDAKGLYFINPDSTEVSKPTQVWTQGQPESNSVWFPTIDSPNERMTQEVFIRVRQEFQTLSNGSLVYSNYHDDGTRTDYWKQDLSHPPYLAMLAAGDFLAAQDKFTRSDGSTIPVTYYLEREYAPYAWKIFGNTPEMMRFYSDLLGVEYPWEKYAQIVVRDYVSGAMENTTAVIHGEFLNRTDRELLDDNDEDIIAHELFHHWFGDFVTCEDWSNLPLNESFATYGEYLWEEYKYGRDAADYQGWQSELGYLNEARIVKYPLIRYDWETPDDMFNAHSYNKGGRILHFLREVLGDEAFFGGLNRYLTQHAYTDVEADELRLALESYSGLDLKWFFDQWFFSPGHPVIDLSYFYNTAANEQQIVVTQKHDLSKSPVYRLPVDIALHYRDTVVTVSYTVTESQAVIRIPSPEAPVWVGFDARRSLLAVRNDEKPRSWWRYQLANAGLPFRDRVDAVEFIADSAVLGDYTALEAALADPFWYIRLRAMQVIDQLDSLSDRAAERIAAMARKEQNTGTRAEAIRILSRYSDVAGSLSEDELKRFYTTERSYNVNAAAIEALYAVQPDEGLKLAREAMERSDQEALIEAASTVFISSGDPELLGAMGARILNSADVMRFRLLQNYNAFLARLPDGYLSNGVSLLETLFEEPIQEGWIRYMAYNLLGNIRMRSGKGSEVHLRTSALLDRLIPLEENPRLVRQLEGYR